MSSSPNEKDDRDLFARRAQALPPMPLPPLASVMREVERRAAKPKKRVYLTKPVLAGLALAAAVLLGIGVGAKLGAPVAIRAEPGPTSTTVAVAPARTDEATCGSTAMLTCSDDPVSRSAEEAECSGHESSKP